MKNVMSEVAGWVSLGLFIFTLTVTALMLTEPVSAGPSHSERVVAAAFATEFGFGVK